MVTPYCNVKDGANLKTRHALPTSSSSAGTDMVNVVDSIIVVVVVVAIFTMIAVLS